MRKTWSNSIFNNLWEAMRNKSEKAMATHSSTLAWKIPWAEEPGRLQSMEFSRPEYWKWVAFPFTRVSSQPRDWTQVSNTVGKFFTSWATREACKPLYSGEPKHNYFLIKLIVTSIPGTEEPGGLLSLGLHRVGHDWSDLAATAAARRQKNCTQNDIDSETLWH